MLKTIGVALLVAGLATNASWASSRHCEDNAKADLYLSQPVDGMTPAAIADNFLREEVGTTADDSVQRFWQEFATSDKDVAALVENWDADPATKKAVADRRQLIEALRRLRATIIAFEDARATPENAAQILAGKWNDWRAEHMSRAEFVHGFLSEVSDRTDQGVPVYGATLQAAQALRNRLDDLNDAAGGRNPPEDRYEMWLWDSYLRGKAASAEVDALRRLPDGDGLWNDYVGERRNTIRCVAAELDSNGSPQTNPLSVGETIARAAFPTQGYSNPAFFRAIYDGETQGMKVSQVGFYLTAFIKMFTNSDIPECQNVVSYETLLRIAGAGSMDVLQQIFGGLAQAHQGGGGRDDMFGQGFAAGAGTFGGMILDEASAQTDAQTFYDRHGCDTAVANRFFGNVTEFARQN